MNRKGQALVEFVLILPVFLFLIFAVYDFGMIFSKKNVLESDSSDIISLYREGTSIDTLSGMYKNVSIDVSNDGKYSKFVISTNVNVITPGLNRILGNPYRLTVERYIPYEQ